MSASTFETIQQAGISIIVALQSLQNPALDAFFNLASHMGALGYLLVIPFVIWCIEPRVGLRALLAMIIAQYLIMLIKDIVQEPRPCVFDPSLDLTGNCEHGFSFPSGHAMGSMVFYGLIALWSEKKWLRYSLFGLIAAIGVSRSYLGVHYPHDVATGWLLGALMIWGWLKYQDPVAKGFYKLGVGSQLLLALLLPTAVGIAHNMVFDYPGALAICGAVSATMLCMIRLQLLPRKQRCYAEGIGLAKKAGRFVFGFALIAVSFVGLGKLVPAEQSGNFYAFSLWLFGFTVVAVMGFLAPRLFPLLKIDR